MRAEHRREQCLSCRYTVTEKTPLTGYLLLGECIAPAATAEEIMKGERAGICLSWDPPVTSEKEEG